MGGLKKFFSNKNTITFLGMLAGVAVLYLGYSYRVSQAVSLVSIPVAKSNIGPRVEITDELITRIRIPSSTIAKFSNLVTDIDNIRGKYVSYNTTISKNSFFFSESLMDADEMPDFAIENIKDGYTIFTLPVTVESTYGNSIFPGNYIDLYLAGKSKVTGKILYGKFIKSIEVLDVKDTSGQHIYESNSEGKIPANLLFAVPDDLHEMLEKAKRIDGITLVPVLRNKAYSSTGGATEISSDYFETLILNNSLSITQDS